MDTMAFNFLERSPSYVEKTSAHVRKRRAIVAKYLQMDDPKMPYRLPRGRSKEIVEELARHGILANPSNINFDSQVYREAYLYVMGDERDRQRIEGSFREGAPIAKSFLGAFVKDNVTPYSLGLVGRNLPQPDVEEEAPPPPPTNGAARKIPIIRTPEEARAAIERMQPQAAPEPARRDSPGLPEDAPLRQRLLDAAGAINAALHEADELLDKRREAQESHAKADSLARSLRTTISDLRIELAKAHEASAADETAPLKRRIEELERQQVHSEEAARNAAKDYEIRDEMISLLERQVDEARVASLERLATEMPQYPRLSMIAQEAAHDRAKALRSEQDIIARLPLRYDWRTERGEIRYQPYFIDSMRDLRPEEQGQIMRAISTLSLQGGSYPGLQTKKIVTEVPKTPKGALFSRASGELRFTWMKQDGVIVFYFAYRKGDTRLHQKE